MGSDHTRARAHPLELRAEGAYWFPMAAITDYHELGALKRSTFIILHFWRSEVQKWVSWGQNQGAACLPEAAGKNLFPFLFQLAEAAGMPWSMAASLEPLLPSSQLLP